MQLLTPLSAREVVHLVLFGRHRLRRSERSRGGDSRLHPWHILRPAPVTHPEASGNTGSRPGRGTCWEQEGLEGDARALYGREAAWEDIQLQVAALMERVTARKEES